MKDKTLAEESEKTKKAREKLKRRLDTFDAKMTKEALEKKTVEIHRWIARHADNRVILREKSISLFDENQNAAEISQRIFQVAKRLREGTTE